MTDNTPFLFTKPAMTPKLLEEKKKVYTGLIEYLEGERNNHNFADSCKLIKEIKRLGAEIKLNEIIP